MQILPALLAAALVEETRDILREIERQRATLPESAQDIFEDLLEPLRQKVGGRCKSRGRFSV